MAASAVVARAETVAVARIAGEEVRCTVAQPRERDACAAALLARLRTRAEEAFIVEQDLRATEAELAALEAYNRTFELHDRKQRARKLEDLDARLSRDADPAERRQLERFRAVLVRLAAYEADVDAGTEARVEVPVEVLRQWIESAKLERALYARYGGSVGLRAAGPYAHGARAALLADYLGGQGAQLLDADIEQRLQAMLAAPPRLAFRGEAPDFTPFWQRPIPPSYMAD
jgi:hypothetical protein